MLFVAFVSIFKKMYFCSRIPFFLFFVFSTFSVAQSGVRSKDHIAFGAPEKLEGSQLPTYLDVAKHFLYTQDSLQSETGNGKVSLRVIAVKVSRGSVRPSVD